MDTLAELYLDEMGGSRTKYHENLAQGYRNGQAFFNSLSEIDQSRLQGRPEDPFHDFSNESVLIAITWLIDNPSSREKHTL